ncbi:organic solute transporter Ostalpha-domain-containing protein [Blyttiomyces helicus]|uniref:Organic solute transporter Ostalpha-domain-containing protein n=1 Tax=Blyttiomyces helicus TaxID=388810 RepID=A0A4P9WHT0_9FUNG|nr:organic solute transporter Ostalpha-domain-containing protein [Blyttiomyces helicus]|eukprot:RKO91952.1 organic solute transporter Ostalpha-domain-containing protein [Blyttiomyces helicus]
MFYLVIHHDIEEHKPLWKVVAVKFVVLFSFWQSIILDILSLLGVLKGNGYISADNLSDLIQSFLVCAEMVIAAFLHIKAFSHTEFIPLDRNGNRDKTHNTRILPSLMSALSPLDIWNDIMAAPQQIEAQRRRRRERRAKRVLNDFGDAFDERPTPRVSTFPDVELGRGDRVAVPVSPQVGRGQRMEMRQLHGDEDESDEDSSHQWSDGSMDSLPGASGRAVGDSARRRSMGREDGSARDGGFNNGSLDEMNSRDRLT